MSYEEDKRRPCSIPNFCHHFSSNMSRSYVSTSQFNICNCYCFQHTFLFLYPSLLFPNYYTCFHINVPNGDSMKVGNTFWPNLVMKTWLFTHVLDRSPRNAYMPCEFQLAVKKQMVEYYVGLPMTFKKKYSDVI